MKRNSDACADWGASDVNSALLRFSSRYRSWAAGDCLAGWHAGSGWHWLALAGWLVGWLAAGPLLSRGGAFSPRPVFQNLWGGTLRHPRSDFVDFLEDLCSNADSYLMDSTATNGTNYTFNKTNEVSNNYR